MKIIDINEFDITPKNRINTKIISTGKKSILFKNIENIDEKIIKEINKKEENSKLNKFDFNDELFNEFTTIKLNSIEKKVREKKVIEKVINKIYYTYNSCYYCLLNKKSK